ncbi:MAG: phosphoribosylanthranilate isomerase [Prevotellaceae bacterium]|nr:phosphoribosylanthranilate isomerase [Prevotellaceae bacterium]
MKNPQNIQDLVKLNPDFIGFIFYEKSPRFCGKELQNLDFVPKNIKKIGVFVNESTDKILEIAKKYGLDGVQLHGNETPEMCKTIKAQHFLCIKAFSIAESADFAQTKAYEGVADYFLFDTKTHLTPNPSPQERGVYGGSGQKFDWAILNDYQGNTPFLLSGGISADDAGNIRKITHPLFFGIDINSKFEIEAGVKNVELIKMFIEKVSA